MITHKLLTKPAKGIYESAFSSLPEQVSKIYERVLHGPPNAEITCNKTGEVIEGRRIGYHKGIGAFYDPKVVSEIRLKLTNPNGDIVETFPRVISRRRATRLIQRGKV